MMAGFERTASTEPKFKALADALSAAGIPSFRFDHSGMGLSDGDFSRISIRHLSGNLRAAIRAVKKAAPFQELSFISHSLPPCLLSQPDLRKKFKKMIMIAPALNQKDLMRYWFVRSAMKKTHPQLAVNWENYQKYLDEAAFRKYCRQADKMTKAHYGGIEYFIESSQIDYSLLIDDTDDILHIHGEKDDTVPLASLNTTFKNAVIVKDGDHDLERPDLLKKWLKTAISFIIS